MSKLHYLEKLLDGAEVEWVQLGHMADIGTGSSNRKDESDDGLYPFYVRSKYVLKSDTFQFDETAIVIPGEGGIGDIFHYVEGKYALHQRAYRICVGQNSLNVKFLYHFMRSCFKQYILMKSVGATSISIRKPMLEGFLVPIPCPNNPQKSLAIQTEIARILDSFTALTTELTTELSLRQKQYQYYRDLLLDFDDGEVEWVPLSKLVFVIAAPVKLKKEMYQNSGEIPIIDQGAKFIAGYTNEEIEPVSDNEYIIFGDHSEHIKYVDFAFVQGADGLKILKPISNNTKYIYHAFTNFYQKELNYKRHWSKAKETPIPIPCPNNPQKSLAIQTEIARILDAFTELTIELTTELSLRQKQYQYYRDLLLSFD